MDSMHLCFLNTLKAALEGVNASFEEALSQQELEHLLRLAQEHSVLPMIYGATRPDPSLRRDFPGQMGAARASTLRQVGFQVTRTVEFLALQRHLEAAGLRPLVVKGLICRQLYPQPDARVSSDEDVLIRPEEFEAYHDALLRFGMETSCDPDTMSRSYEVPYRKTDNRLYIELHKSLFPLDSDAYGDFNAFFEGAHERATAEQIDGMTVWTLSPTDHLFYLICHAFKHFLHSGFGIRQVCDITLYANTYGAQVDWAHIVENCRAIHADGFCAALFRIGEKYLTLDPDRACLPAVWTDAEVDETLMLQDLLDGGIYGGADMNRRHSSAITLDAVAAQKQGRKAKGGIMVSLFPPLQTMRARFHYLKKCPWLLPFAWVQRILLYTSEIHETPANSAVDSLKIGRERIEMMRVYGIIK